MWNTKQNIKSYGKQGVQLLKWGCHSASLDKTKYNAEGNADSLRVATKSCNKQLNRFYGYPTSPSASVMAQNIQLFGPHEGFLTYQWMITGNK